MSSLKLSLPDYSWQDPEQQGTDRKSPSLLPAGSLGIAAACQRASLPTELSSWVAAAHTPPDSPLSPEALYYYSLPFCWRGINLFWRCDSSDDYTVWGKESVTHCYMLGLSLTVPRKPDKTLSGETSSSGDRGKWLNRAPLVERFVQFKDRIGWQKDLMFQKDTIDYGTGTEA